MEYTRDRVDFKRVGTASNEDLVALYKLYLITTKKSDPYFLGINSQDFVNWLNKKQVKQLN
jgi:hypothetical protein